MSHLLRLVTFEDPIFATVQGEGKLVGTPSTFIRLHGCDYSCSWCDTKDSWRAGSTYTEIDVESVVDRARSFGLRHVVVTGGNPMIHKQLPELITALNVSYVSEGRHVVGMHVTLETQGSVYDEASARAADLLSLSPKMHAGASDYATAVELAALSLNAGKDTQFKIVVSTEDETGDAIALMHDMYREIFLRLRSTNECRLSEVSWFLQPEHSTGRKGVHVVCEALQAWEKSTRWYSTGPSIRVLPQVHKTAFFMR